KPGAAVSSPLTTSHPHPHRRRPSLPIVGALSPIPIPVASAPSLPVVGATSRDLEASAGGEETRAQRG
uniref:Uncharacterized protein n=1 Tax=Oryza nivara TaxID=4536 RepID=A0A0E0J1A7_ORYNI